MKKAIAVVAILVTGLGAALEWWRRHPRTGAATVNRIVNPWLVRQGVSEASRGEIGLLEHVGRKSGTVRIAPVHPVSIADGFRIIVPLGLESQWARNVIAAGHCRLQVGDAVHELDEPKLVAPLEVDGIPRLAAQVMDWLGFRYLRLHEFAVHAGALVAPTEAAAAEASVTPPRSEPLGPEEPLPTEIEIGALA